MCQGNNEINVFDWGLGLTRCLQWLEPLLEIETVEKVAERLGKQTKCFTSGNGVHSERTLANLTRSGSHRESAFVQMHDFQSTAADRVSSRQGFARMYDPPALGRVGS
jgi:hypothetical protein